MAWYNKLQNHGACLKKNFTKVYIPKYHAGMAFRGNSILIKLT
jgi:hypothetical protein